MTAGVAVDAILGGGGGGGGIADCDKGGGASGGGAIGGGTRGGDDRDGALIGGGTIGGGARCGGAMSCGVEGGAEAAGSATDVSDGCGSGNGGVDSGPNPTPGLPICRASPRTEGGGGGLSGKGEARPAPAVETGLGAPPASALLRGPAPRPCRLTTWAAEAVAVDHVDRGHAQAPASAFRITVGAAATRVVGSPAAGAVAGALGAVAAAPASSCTALRPTPWSDDQSPPAAEAWRLARLV
eukprot:scaffold13947_cov108-Isochrysis_galbana.AAC.3